MDTGVIIAIIVGVLILLALLWLVTRASRGRRYEKRRTEAREIQREADLSRAQADKTRAEAEAQSAEARRQDALARERAASAEEQRQEARERHIEAAKKDPDADPDEAADAFDREHPRASAAAGTTEPGTTESGTTGAGATTRGDGVTDADDDQSVQHYERTRTPEGERERRFERDESGEVVRDEEYEPRSNR
ncbi:MAG TPA: hypothetical protein VH683_01475 [Thermoleophilaceae bacterium]|jgi:FtsZ-interacting cell division protein ZipA